MKSKVGDSDSDEYEALRDNYGSPTSPKLTVDLDVVIEQVKLELH